MNLIAQDFKDVPQSGERECLMVDKITVKFERYGKVKCLNEVVDASIGFAYL